MGLLIWAPPPAHLAILLALGAVCAVRVGQMPALPDLDAPPALAVVQTAEDSPFLPLPEVGLYDDALPSMDARPLFSAGRRLATPSGIAQPAPEADAPAPQAGDEDLGLHLKAVIGRGDARRALVITRGGAEELWVQEGDDLAGWQVMAIGSRRLDLRLGDRTATFEMFD